LHDIKRNPLIRRNVRNPLIRRNVFRYDKGSGHDFTIGNTGTHIRLVVMMSHGSID
jgi:hypothetical protein